MIVDSSGDEYGVLEDLFVAVSDLSNVKFQVQNVHDTISCYRL